MEINVLLIHVAEKQKIHKSNAKGHTYFNVLNRMNSSIDATIRLVHELIAQMI